MKKFTFTIGVVAFLFPLVVLLLIGDFSRSTVPKGRLTRHGAAKSAQTEPANETPIAQPQSQTNFNSSDDSLIGTSNAVVLSSNLVPAAPELDDAMRNHLTDSDSAASSEQVEQFDDADAPATLSFAAASWASTNLTAALSWLGTLPEGEAKTAASTAVAYEMARTDPVAALRLASPWPASRERDELLVHSISQWVQTDVTAATTWAASVPDAALRQRLVASAAVALAEKDGTAAATLAGTALSPGAEQDRTAVSIVQVWAQSAPQAAAHWVSQFQNTALRTAAVRGLISVWTPRDATAAANWLNALLAGPDRDAGQAAYKQAMTLLSSVTD